jgi:hypothetical protein
MRVNGWLAWFSAAFLLGGALLTAALLVAAYLEPGAQTFGTLTAVPTHPNTGLTLSWGSSPAGTNTLYRWKDGENPAVVTTTSGTSYVDPIASNIIYNYRVINGQASTNIAIGVISDTTQPYVCPAMSPVALGVDRAVSFVSASGKPISFTVEAPRGMPGTVYNLSPCNGASGCSDRVNFQNAMNAIYAAQSNGAVSAPSTIQMADGDYYFTGGDFTSIGIGGSATDLTVSGAGFDANGIPLTHLYFSQNAAATIDPMAVFVSKSNRVLFRNLMIDWDKPNAIPGTMTNIPGDSAHQRFVVKPGTESYYVPDPAHPPMAGVYSWLVGYDLTNRMYIQKNGARVGAPMGTFNPNFGSNGGYYWVTDAGYFPDGTGALLYLRTPGNIFVGGATNTSFENVHVYGGGGYGLITNMSKGLRLSNVKFTRKPDSILRPGEQPRYYSFIGDNDLNVGLGDILIENSEFGFIDDDTFYNRGTTQYLSSLSSTTGFTINGTILNPFGGAPQVGDIIQFIDPRTLMPVGGPVALTTTVTAPQFSNPSNWTVTFPSVPELAPYIGLAADRLPLITMPSRNGPNFVFRENCVHDNHGRVFMGQDNSLVEDNIVVNSYFGPIVVSGAPTFNAEATLPNNVVIRRNKVIGAGWGLTDLSWFGTVDSIKSGFLYANSQGGSAAILVGDTASNGFVAPAGVIKWVHMNDNFISNVPGVAISGASVDHLSVNRNVIVDANAVRFATGYHATYCGKNSHGYRNDGAGQPYCGSRWVGSGSIWINNVTNYEAVGNSFLGTSQGLSIDAGTVRQTEMTGSMMLR